MIYKYSILLLTFFITNTLWAQKYNKTDTDGNKTGFWEHKSATGKILAKGRYESGMRIGEWKFYLSPLGQYTQTPDIIGNYENGVKQGKWEYLDSRSKVLLKGEFSDDLMNGIWKYYDKSDNLLAKGFFENGVRHGKWILYRGAQKMAVGYYRDGEKIGTWVYDYYLKGNTHIIGEFGYEEGLRNGTLKFYKVEKHPKFETEEILVGTGDYRDGLKTGRWIEYRRGLRGEFIETGHYNGHGKREGLWKYTIDNEIHQEAAYNEGKLQGTFKLYYSDGTLKYETFYENGLEHGYFTRYYEDGTVKEKGAYTTSEQEHIDDTIFHKIELPYEYSFLLIEQDYENLNYNAINWIDDLDYSVHKNKMDKAFTEFLDYGKRKKLRVERLVKSTKQVVRVGKYLLNHRNGKLHLEGKYYPAVSWTKDPNTNTEYKDFARDGEWKEYDDNGYLRKTYTYEKGKLITVLDSKGRTMEDNPDGPK